MIDSLFKVLASGLSLWDSKERTKYVDKMISIKKAYYEEINKPEEIRSGAVLANLEFELRLICTAFCSGAGAKNSLSE